MAPYHAVKHKLTMHAVTQRSKSLRTINSRLTALFTIILKFCSRVTTRIIFQIETVGILVGPKW